ncbi:two-component system, response regulator YcbB [Clostridium collagenovorans DSM 3089]|uniref:Stage 0 sporulation protein A homolog n=1 Tax=Clostridium collagenovorans DSM 3089 TaxID=1121306 RepID=A0A1M5Y9T5_9CLOT|nr:response regulator [Clostridium collagenovorans]SHI08679.1 two-component system, response regulator YcbB [Clostridium collagenovorans DSM 3089]
MKIFLVDDDSNVINILTMIIEDRDLGEVIGSCNNGIDAIQDIIDLKPDIAIVDLLMPNKDGIAVVNECREAGSNTKFIMLSQVNNKEMVAKAYEKGVEFYIHKPVNAIEVEQIMKKVIEYIDAQKKLYKIQNIFSDDRIQGGFSSREDTSSYVTRIKAILQKLGIMGEIGSKDIIQVIEYLIENNQNANDYTMRELCTLFTDTPKSMEQRIRRAATVGMINMANLGIEDYMNEIFIEYSNGLYNFEQIKREMDYIRGNTVLRGKINIKKFINGIIFYSEKV